MSIVNAVAARVLAATTPSPSPSPTLKVDPDRVTPGALGFLAVVFLGVAVFLLWKSLNKQVKRVDFDEEHTFTRAKDRARYEASQERLDAELAGLTDAADTHPDAPDAPPADPAASRD